MCILALSLEGHEDDKFYENDSKDPKEIKFFVWVLRGKGKNFNFQAKREIRSGWWIVKKWGPSINDVTEFY